MSVKGGGLKADDVRARNHVRQRAGAAIARLISLAEPVHGMVAGAASAGSFQAGLGRKFPRLPLLAIGGLLNHSQCAEPPGHQPDLNFTEAKAEADATPKDLL